MDRCISVFTPHRTHVSSHSNQGLCGQLPAFYVVDAHAMQVSIPASTMYSNIIKHWLTKVLPT